MDKVIPTNGTSAEDIKYANTVKKVYIYGVDVSECKYLNKVVDEEPYCNIDGESLYTCSCDVDCYYKQLMRARAEIEKYQNGDIHWNTYSGVFKAFDKDGNEVKFPTENTNYYIKQLKRKEQECEELTKQKDILLGQLVINDGEDVTVQISQSQFDEYNELKAECERLKEEIKSMKL